MHDVANPATSLSKSQRDAQREKANPNERTDKKTVLFSNKFYKSFDYIYFAKMKSMISLEKVEEPLLSIKAVLSS